MRTALLLALPALLAPATAADTVTVTQVGLDFVPPDITINVGDTVQWIWTGGNHTVTEGTDGTVDGDEVFHSDLDQGTQSYSFTFDAAVVAANGNFYDYFCEPHVAIGQVGTVTVTDSAITTYCTAKTSSAGCTASIGSSDPANSPVSLAGGYMITASDVHTFKNGLLFAGISGPANIPFGGGILCVTPPNKRGPVMNSAGSGLNLCDGAFMTEVNTAIIPAGLDPGSGNTAWYQYWYRDPANGSGNFGTALSDAAEVDFL